VLEQLESRGQIAELMYSLTESQGPLSSQSLLINQPAYFRGRRMYVAGWVENQNRNPERNFGLAPTLRASDCRLLEPSEARRRFS
jgi:hypothetical protein